LLDIILAAEERGIMALDAALRRQLVAARKNITTQLMQLEGAAIDPFSLGGSPDCRDVYAELQRELHEIDDMLGTAADGREGEPSGASGYEPMATFAAPQAQWMWRFRGVAVGQVALFVIAWVALFSLRNGRSSLLTAGACLTGISLVSVLVAGRNREPELRLLLFTLAIGTGLVGAAVLAVAFTT
jgi:hypothetical protein